MNIYLAGDSIVQNYTEEEFIAGWGQFLPRFFKSSFINKKSLTIWHPIRHRPVKNIRWSSVSTPQVSPDSLSDSVKKA